MILLETYELEDLYDYDLTTYNSLATSPLTLPNGNFELTYKSILKTNTPHNTNLNIYGVLNDDTTQVISVIGIAKRTGKNGFHTSFVVNGVWEEYWHISPVTVNSEYLVKYIYNNGQHSLYVDGDLLITTSKIMKNMHDIAVGPNQNEWIKDLKVKPL